VNQNKIMETIKNLAKALVKATAQIEGASKDSTNPHFRNKYADLASVTDAIKKPLNDNGLTYSQIIHRLDGGVGVETLIIHESGETMSNGITFVPAPKNDPHGYGSALTYARRYSLSACFGVIQEDDDANGASNKLPMQVPNKPVTKPSAPQTKQAEVKQLQPFTEEKYLKLLELHETDPTLLDKLQDHYRIGQEWKERFYKDTNKIWK
jgi:hypothetical protein